MTGRRLGVALLVAGALLITGCSATPPAGPSTPSGIDVGRSIAFAEVDGEQLALDACIPKDRSAGPFPAAVLLHGGAFQEGDRSNMLSLCKSLAAEGIAAFPIDYRLLPSSYPAQVDDTISAVEWLREPEQLDRFDISAEAISLLGSSAGGIIALSAADRLGLAGTPAASVVTLSAGGNLTPEALQLGNPDPALEKVVLGYLGCTDIDDCAVTREASPVFNVAGLPPSLLVHGSDELIPIEQANALESAISAAGIPVTLEIVEGERHGLQLMNAKTAASVLAFLVENSTP